jgi:hypothetical protein
MTFSYFWDSARMRAAKSAGLLPAALYPRTSNCDLMSSAWMVPLPNRRIRYGLDEWRPRPVHFNAARSIVHPRYSKPLFPTSTKRSSAGKAAPIMPCSTI